VKAAPTALIAEDEPLLRESLEQMLHDVWPELVVTSRARNGREAIQLFDRHQPGICFLDVHMPGVSGLEAARHIGRRAHLVFVTAHDHYAVQAFAHGVLDYLVKPVEPERLAHTVLRLKERLRTDQAPSNNDELLRDLVTKLAQHSKSAPLRWLRASVGASISLIPVADIDYLRAEDKYTTVAWHDERDTAQEGVIRTPLKEILSQLDDSQFVQVHRSVVVNLQAIAKVVRGDNDTAQIHLKTRRELLPVSRSFVHLFRQM
jgi:DNA-binding LytR/AlgR family response regulator